MRWSILETLIRKEARRHLANRGGLALAVLLLGMALLMRAYDKTSAVRGASGGIISGVHHCHIDYWEDSPWIEYLKQKVPPSLSAQIHFRDIREPKYVGADGMVHYQTGTGGIQIRPLEANGAEARYKIWIWYPGEDRSIMASYENWFWRHTRAYFHKRIEEELAGIDPKDRPALPPLDSDETWVWRESHQQFRADVRDLSAKLPLETSRRIEVPELEFERSPLNATPVGTRNTIASALVLFAIFFVCVYLLPSLTCEERERGVLLAQALSPASPYEILGAKLLFYPAFGVAFGSLLAGVLKPVVLLQPFFWATLIVLAVGSLGIGTTISCAAKSQRAASMGALCYMLVVSMVVLVCQQNHIPYVPEISLEYHGPRMIHAVFAGTIGRDEYRQLGKAAVLAVGWNLLAAWCFRRFGWQ